MMRRRPSEKGSSMVLKIASIFNSQLITKEAVLNLGPEGPVRLCDICRIDG